MPNLRITATLLLWIPAAVLFGLGFVLDENGWTAAHGFTSNILAAGTSGLLGLPVAAIVVQWILRQDADERRRRELVRAARRGLSGLRHNIEQSGIDKLRRINKAVTPGRMSLLVLRIGAEIGASVTPSALAEGRTRLRILQSTISENLPNMEERLWSFPTLVRRWEATKETILIPAETAGLSVISDLEYQVINRNIHELSSDVFEWLPNLLQDMEYFLGILDHHDPAQSLGVSPDLRPTISQLFATIEALETQVRIRVELHDVLIAVDQSVQRLRE